jgi:hypothetical protein
MRQSVAKSEPGLGQEHFPHLVRQKKDRFPELKLIVVRSVAYLMLRNAGGGIMKK